MKMSNFAKKQVGHRTLRKRLKSKDKTIQVMQHCFYLLESYIILFVGKTTSAFCKESRAQYITRRRTFHSRFLQWLVPFEKKNGLSRREEQSFCLLGSIFNSYAFHEARLSLAILELETDLGGLTSNTHTDSLAVE